MNLNFFFIQFVFYYLMNCCFSSSINSNSLPTRFKRGFSDVFNKQSLRPIIPAGKKVNQAAKKFWDKLDCLTGGQNEHCVKNEDGSYQPAQPTITPDATSGSNDLNASSRTDSTNGSPTYTSSTPYPTSYSSSSSPYDSNNPRNPGSSFNSNDNSSPITGSNVASDADPNNSNSFNNNRPSSSTPGARENSPSNLFERENDDNRNNNSNVSASRDKGNERLNKMEKSEVVGLPDIAGKERANNGSRLVGGSTPNDDFKNNFFNSDLGRTNGSSMNSGDSSSFLPSRNNDFSTASSLLDKYSRPDESVFKPNDSTSDRNAASAISMNGCTCTCPSADSPSSSTVFEIVDAEKEEERKPGNSNVRFRLIKKNSPIVYVKRPNINA